MFMISGQYYEEFETYRDAEIYCGEHGIPCEEIFEDDDDDFEE